jgi:hypothetical protein
MNMLLTCGKTMQIETYAKEFEEMDKASKEEYLNSLRRQSSGFSRGLSKYRGVARLDHSNLYNSFHSKSKI